MNEILQPMDSPEIKVAKSEFCIVMLLLALYVVANYLTIQCYPFVGFIDDVSYSDPAVNWHQGNGFTSTAWYGQPKEEIWVSNAPGHPLLLCAWIGAFGFSVPSVRMLNIVLLSLAAFVLWLSAVRGAWLKTPFCRILLVPMLITSPALVVTARMGRPDAITVLWVATAVLAATVKSQRQRRIGFFLLGALIPVVGFQLGPYVAVLTLVALLVFGWRQIWRDALWTAVGIGVGLTLLLIVLVLLGSFHLAYVFLASTIASKHTSVGTVAQAILMKNAKMEPVPEAPGFFATIPLLYIRDKFYVMFGVLLTTFITVQWMRGKFVRSSPAVICLLAGLLMPVCIFTAGKYPPYYGWMAFLPMIIGFIAALDQLNADRNRLPVAGGVIVFVAAMILTPLPIVIQVWLNKEMYDDLPIRVVVKQNVHSDDVMMCDWAAYYAAKPLAKQLYMCGRGATPDDLTGYSGGKLYPEMSKEEKESISLLIIRPELLGPVIKRIGGDWKEVDPGFSVGEFRGGQWLHDYLDVKRSWAHPYHFGLRAYRRSED